MFNSLPMATTIITQSDLYWLTRLDHIHNVIASPLWILPIFMLVGGCIAWGASMAATENRPARKPGIWLTFLGATGLIILTGGMMFIPTTKEMIVIKVVPAIANNETIQSDISGAHDDVKEMVIVCKDYLKKKLTEQMESPRHIPRNNNGNKDSNEELMEKINMLNSKIDALESRKSTNSNVEKALDKVVEKGISKLAE